MADDRTPYRWNSSGGCERCDSMPTNHESEPSRPHPNCGGQIIKIPKGTGRCRYPEPRIELDCHGDHDGYDPAGSFTAIWEFRITCRDGTEIVGQFSTEKAYADWETWEDQDVSTERMMDEAMQIAEAHAETECPECEPDPVA